MKANRPLILQSSSPLLKLLLPFFLLTLACRVSCLYIHGVVQDPKVYSQQTYYSQLQGMQVRLSNDLNRIKDKFKDINNQLANTNISASEKVIALQQSLADERDSLFNIQNYLNVPFALRSCQCVNVTAQQKENLKTQIQDVSKSITQLESIVNTDSSGKPYENPNCPNGQCAAVGTINIEVKQMKNYIRIMNDTITSQCCKIVHYIFHDNLVSTNSWVYGTTNQEKYRMDLFNLAKDANLSRCPQFRPFANLQTNECFACPANKPIFDLGSRQCTPPCESKQLIFILAQHQCDYNRTCDEGKYFNNNTNRCEVSLGTASSCPKERPIWSIKQLTCIKCDAVQPYYDIALKSCRKCTANEVWQVQTQSCIDKALITANCSNGTFFSLQTSRCQIYINKTVSSAYNPSGSYTPPQQTPTSGTYSQCPPSTPFWSQSDLTCYKCPENTPSYSSTSNKCEPCPANTTWSAPTQTCEKNHLECPENQVYNSVSNSCQQKIECKSNEVFNSVTGKCDTYSSTGQIGMCPPESPFWNAKTLYCEKCSTQTPYWNTNAKECQACPVNTAWDPNSETCKSTIKKCPVGQVYNTKTTQCETINCTAASPIYNFATGSCEGCPEGTKYNNLTFICESTTPQLRTNTSVCPSTNPYWNPQRLSCDVCPLGQSLNDEQTCQPGVSHFKVTPIFNNHQAENSQQHRKQVPIHQSSIVRHEMAWPRND